MRPSWLFLNDKDRDSVRALMSFIDGRLAERRTVEWALEAKPYEMVKRVAILQSLLYREGNELKEPWRTAWRMIEESWDYTDLQMSSAAEAHRVQRRVLAGERTGALIAAIVSLVQPRLKVSLRSDAASPATTKPIRRVEDFLYASVDSHELVDLNVYRIDNVDDVAFLVSLATALEAAVNHGLSIGRRVGWESDHKLFRLGQLYYVGYQQRANDGQNWDVDKFHHGIAPAVKLLHAVVKRLSDLDRGQANAFVVRWKHTPNPVHLRLWASLSQIDWMTTAAELSATLPYLNDREFWDIHTFPEFAELRALRFGEFSQASQAKMITRIKKGAPASFWPKGAEVERLRRARTYSALRELRRIEVAGHQLPPPASAWLDQRIGEFPDLRDMPSVSFGFLMSAVARWVTPQPDGCYSELHGDDRLRALEIALTSSRSNWNDDPAEGATDWIREGDNASLVLNDLEAAGETGAAFPNVWDRFGWSHKAPDRGSEANGEFRQVGERVMGLLENLPTGTLQKAIQGITHWLSEWDRVIIHSCHLLNVWSRVWPIAVVVTNESSVESDALDLDERFRAAPDEDQADFDTLNTPAGKLVGVFLRSCPTVDRDATPFQDNGVLRSMRNDLAEAGGRAGLIARHRLIEDLPYFLRVDEQWARAHLVAALTANDASSLALWRAIAQRTQFTDVLEVIGSQFAERVLDRGLGRETRGSLLTSLILESLHAFRENRNPVVSNAKIQQTLRAVDDEVRAAGAQAVQRYLSWMANNEMEGTRHTAEDVFRLSVAPFLAKVWPQERSLATRGVSAAFADLPVAAGEAFADAVDSVERFMVPFDCWSMSEYGFWGHSDEVPRLARINTAAKAAALLRLLDTTIGTSEGSVVPMDLAEGLDQIRATAPTLVQSPAFRRLATFARRR